MENITATITVTLTPDDIDAIVDTLIECVDVYNPWDDSFLRNLREDIRVYCEPNYTIEAIMDDPATAHKLIKAVATRLGERYAAEINKTVSTLL